MRTDPLTLRIYCHQWYLIGESDLPEWDKSVRSGMAPRCALPVDPQKIQLFPGGGWNINH